MKVSLLKIARKKEVIKRLELEELAEMIRKNPEDSKVFNLRLNYLFTTLLVLFIIIPIVIIQDRHNYRQQISFSLL